MAKQQINKEGFSARRLGRWFWKHKIVSVLCLLAVIFISVFSINQLLKEASVAQKPFTTHSVTSKDGTTIGYRQYGQGPGVILVHGGMMAAQDFSDLASLLSPDFTVYVPDLRGRGMSGPFTKDHSIQKEVEDLQAIMAQTKSQYIFGLSAGAIFSLQTTLKTEQVKKLAIYEPPVPLSGEESTVSWLSEYDEYLAKDNLAGALITVSKGTGDSSPLTWLPRFVTEPFMGFAISAQAEEVKEGEVALKDLIPTIHYDGRVVASMKDKIDQFGDIKAKVLLMNGTKSPQNLQAPIGALEKVLPNAEHFVFQGASHLAATNGEKPRAVAERLKIFFNERD